MSVPSRGKVERRSTVDVPTHPVPGRTGASPSAIAGSTPPDEITLTLPRALIERAISYHQAGGSSDPVALAKRILVDRRRRRGLFPGVRFGDPSWDMMLDLLVAEAEGRTPTVSDMCNAADVPKSTALRHLETLVEQGYMSREDDRADRRRTYVHATTRMRDAVEQWLRFHGAARSEP